MALFLGVDAGGTSTRACVIDQRGNPLGRGRSGGGNPTTRGLATAARSIGDAVRQALAGLDPGDVASAVVGMAGLGVNGAGFADLWHGLRLPAVPRLVGDVDVAYAAGTSAPDGTVLVSGTGAIASAVRDHATDRTTDGLGWLIGDEGSAFALGRHAIRLVLEELRGPGEPVSVLTSSVVSHILGEVPLTPEVVEVLLEAVYTAPPMALAELAPLVAAAAAECPQAAAVVAAGADALVATVTRVRTPGVTTPIVLAGSVLGQGSAIRLAVREELRRRWDTDPVDAGDTAAAAAWLAARTSVADPARLHRELLRSR